MRWPRKGILIRLLIYGPLIGYLGYQAVEKYRAEREVTEADAGTPLEPDREDELEPYKRVIEMPDGSKQEIIQLTPEQAEEILGYPVPDERQPAGSD